MARVKQHALSNFVTSAFMTCVLGIGASTFPALHSQSSTSDGRNFVTAVLVKPLFAQQSQRASSAARTVKAGARSMVEEDGIIKEERGMRLFLHTQWATSRKSRWIGEGEDFLLFDNLVILIDLETSGVLPRAGWPDNFNIHSLVCRQSSQPENDSLIV